MTAVIQGGVCLTDGAWAVGMLAVTSGVSLLVGFLTPASAVVLGLNSLGIALSWVTAPSSNLFDTRLAIVLVITIVASIVLIGPGAYSLDARLFGRREIIIPQASGSSNS